jgi:hypothetical protein
MIYHESGAAEDPRRVGPQYIIQGEKWNLAIVGPNPSTGSVDISSNEWSRDRLYEHD